MVKTQVVDSVAVVTDSTKGTLDIVNAIELKWTLPYEIPADRTTADIVCKTEQSAGGGTLAKDPMRIHQSSMMATGWGAGNCFYLGVTHGNTAGAHKFRCNNMGKMAKSSTP